jgi:hypothetical protein
VYKIYGLHEPNIGFKQTALILLSVLTTIIVALLLTLRFNKITPLTGKLVFSLVVVLFMELMVDSKMIRLPRSDIFSTPSEAIAYVQRNKGLYRTLNFGQGGLYAEMGSALQIQEITSMNQGVLPDYQDYFYSAINLNNSQPTAPRGSFPSLWLIQDKPLSHKFNWQAIDLLGVKYVLLPVDFTAYKTELIRQGLRLVYETPATLVFENPNVLPRAFAVDLPTAEVSLAMMLPTDFREHIHPATITSYKNAEVEISGTASAKMLVVVSDNWHENWHATLNGIEAPIIKINGTLRGVEVPKGDYVVRMTYQPSTLPLAIGISSGVLFLLITMILGHRHLDKLIRRRWLIWA